MSDSTQELRQRFEQQQNETPTVVDDADAPDQGGDQDGDDVDVQDDGGSMAGVGIPTPDVSKRQVALLAVVIAVLLALYLYRQRDGGASSGGLDDARGRDWSSEVPVEEEDEEEDEIKVVKNGEPMEADESVTEAFRERGLLGGSD